MMMSSQEDDPFACFGDDDDDDDDDDEDMIEERDNIRGSANGVVLDDSGSGRERALRLMESHNNAKHETKSTTTQTQIIEHHHHHHHHIMIPSSNYEDQRLRTSLLPWPDVPPLYIGPMHLNNGKRMGRGYVATMDLPPGTCILIETPLISGWSASQSGKRLGLDSVKYILERENDNVNDILKWMEELHPRKSKVDACSSWLFPLFPGGESDNSSNHHHHHHDDEGDNEADQNKRNIDPIDKIQIVDMMFEIMMNTPTTTDDDLDKDYYHHQNIHQQQQQQQVQSLVSYAAQHNIHNSNGSPINCIDIVRLLLTLRYNGFDSGLYLHFSMFNHGEDPNCIKFRPASVVASGEEKEETTTTMTTTVPHYSEARTTRYVRKGEALTLHYLENPREVSHSTRRRQLWEQHRFDIGGGGENVGSSGGVGGGTYGQYLDEEACTPGYLLPDTTRGRCIFESELIHGEFPTSSITSVKTRANEANYFGGSNDTDSGVAAVAAANDVTSNIEKTLDELEDILLDLQVSAPKAYNSTGTTSYYFDQAAALELTIGELITTSTSILGNNHHILLARCRRIHIDVIEMLLATSLLTERQSNELMIRFIQSTQPLLESQRRRLGWDHPDVARTFQDYCMGIQALLSHAPRRLLLLEMTVDENDDNNNSGEEKKQKKKKGGSKKTTRWTLEQWSKMEHYCRLEKKRIEELYPRDVEDILKSVQKNNN